MKLSQLAAAAGAVCIGEAEITALTCRSEEVKPGTLFAALPGARTDGASYIGQAAQRGAAAVLCAPGVACALPTIRCGEPRRSLAPVAAEFYGHPEREMTLIAITGTKGKTTTAHMVREMLLAAGQRVGMLGTLGAFLDRQPLGPTGNTTPEPVTLWRLLRQMADAGCTHVVLEASSQAMKLHRLEGLAFDVGVFLNLSPDHIGPGEHETMEEYRACKGAVLAQCRRVAGNGAHPDWPAVRAFIAPGTEVREFGPAVTEPGDGLTTRLKWPGQADYLIPLPGGFNGENALAAIAAAELLDLPDSAIRAGLANTAVPGRCMVYPAPAPYSVVVDYAHNGASFRALFQALRRQGADRVIAVFGAGGDRPPMRRRELAQAAEEGADYAILTEDNPRGEEAEAICGDISAAMPRLPHQIIPDRRSAIFRALELARPGDVVALLGKGHETYIESKGVRRHFSEWEVLEDYFSRPEGAVPHNTTR